MPQAVEWVIGDNRLAARLWGRGDVHLKRLERALDVHLTARGNVVGIVGAPEAQDQVQQTLDLLAEWVSAGEAVGVETVEAALEAVREDRADAFRSLLTDVVATTVRGRPLRPKTFGQARYVAAMRHHSLVFGIGPAGTGKTFLAMARGVAELKARSVERLVLTRPAVEAGERLGFLPGDLEDKVHPYLRPLYDALFEMLGIETVERYRERGQIEVAPLAYMRGRTLDNSFMILDEAQNTTAEQMKMFLTRIGFGSQVVVTGDITQVDLPSGTASGLSEAAGILQGVTDIAVVRFSQRDVVRHPLVQAIVQAYEAKEQREGDGQANR